LAVSTVRKQAYPSSLRYEMNFHETSRLHPVHHYCWSSDSISTLICFIALIISAKVSIVNVGGD